MLAVVGAGHLVGIRRNLLERGESDTAKLEKVPETSTIGKWIKIIVPVALIIGLFYLGWSQGREFLRENLLFWIAANSLFTGLGAILAGANILAILTAVLVAPFSPFIPAGPGTVAAFVQFIVRPPLVINFQTFADDITHPLRWRKNRILKKFSYHGPLRSGQHPWNLARNLSNFILPIFSGVRRGQRLTVLLITAPS